MESKNVDILSGGNLEFYKRRLLVVFVAGAVCTLPWSYWLNGFFLIGIIFFSIVNSTIFNWKSVDFASRVFVVSAAIYFFLHIVSLLYTDDLKYGLLFVEKKYSFALIPLSLWVAVLSGLRREVVLRYFTCSIVLASIYCLAMAAWNNYTYNLEHQIPWSSFNNWFYSYALLTNNINLHPAYFASYVSVVILYLIINLVNHPPNRRFILPLLLIVYLFFYMVLLSSRNVLGSTILVTLVIFMFFALKRRNVLLVVAGATCLIAMVAAVTLNDITRSRIVEMWDIENQSSQWGSTALRLQQWTASFDIIRANWVVGTGPGDFIHELVAEYKHRGQLDLVEAEYNSHNEFIQTFGSLGIGGLMVVLTMFAVSFKTALSRKDVLHTSFLFIFAVFSLTESTLEVQKGIVFFVLFNSVFLFSKE